MTLFDVKTPKVKRSKKTVTRAAPRPTWSRHTAKVPGRCAECEELALQSLPGPMLPIRNARYCRRQGGESRLLCHEHATAQKEDDKLTLPPIHPRTRGRL